MENEITPPKISSTSDSSQPLNKPTGAQNPAIPPKLDEIIQKPKKPRVEPLIEGINTPKIIGGITVSKPALTENEEKLITETPDFKAGENKLIPKFSMGPEKKSGSIKGVVITALILLLLVLAGYEAYSWYLSRDKTPVPVQVSPTTQIQPGGAIQPVTNTSASTATSTPSEQIVTSSTPFDLAGMSSSTPPATTSPPAITQLKINSTPTGYLNVRSQPSSAGNIIAQVHPGEVYTYTGKQNGWYNITFNGLMTGWVSGQYVTVQ